MRCSSNRWLAFFSSALILFLGEVVAVDAGGQLGQHAFRRS